MLPFCFFLALVFTSTSSEVININTGSERILQLMNTLIKATKETTTKIPAGSISYENGSVSYSEGTLVGLDSMIRTGDCVLKTEPDSLSFDIHFGYSFLTAFFGTVTYEGQYLSASFRIVDNSLRLGFTVHNGTECRISLDAINYEKMSNVILGTSNPELDFFMNPKVDAFFQKNVMPVMDKILNADKASVENSLQFLCRLMPANKLFQLTDFKNVFDINF